MSVSSVRCSLSLSFAIFFAAVIHAEPKVRVIAAPDHGKPIAAKVDAAGTVHLLMNAHDGPRYACSRNGGESFEASLPLVDAASRKPQLEYTAWDLAVSPAGDVHIALGTNAWKLKLPKEEWGFYYARMLKGSEQFEPLRNINRRPSEGFALAADREGRVAACWLADKLYVNFSIDRGETFSKTEELDSSLDPCNCCTVAATYGADGSLAILYREETGNARDMYLVRRDREGSIASRTRVGKTDWKIATCPMSYYSVMPRENGYTVAWPTEGKIFFANLDPQGEAVGPRETRTIGMAGMRSGVFAISDSQGVTLTAWKKEGRLGWQLFSPQARPLDRGENIEGAGNGLAAFVNSQGDFVLMK